ncbi:MAG: DUF4214 domain-containing protein [Actinobacteria bacterium]|nr:DUF4214 domain-containing protein [Actinomycetota bacterium]
MKILKIIKEKKLGLSFLLVFFVLFLISLKILDIFPDAYYISIFFAILLFILSQYFDFDYRIFLGFALSLLIAYPFFLIFELDTLAEYSLTYTYGFNKLDTLAEYSLISTYGFLILSIIGYFFDNLREKLKSKGTIKIKKIVFLSILVLFLLSSAFIFLRHYQNEATYAVMIKENFNKFRTVKIKENFLKFTSAAKDKYIRAFKKDIYYSGQDTVEFDGKKISRDIIIKIDNPKDTSTVSKTLIASGWAIETNSEYNTGIDRIEFFLDGKPGEGKYLGEFSQDYRAELDSKNFIVNLYNNFYNKLPVASELDYWSKNLEYNIFSYYEVANTIINESKFMEKSLSDEDFLIRLYAGLLNRNWDGTWIVELESGMGREHIFYTLINSEEFKRYSEIYYKNISPKEIDLDIMRKDVGEKYGTQFYFSGFKVSGNITKLTNGYHKLYVYAHSPIFGWDYDKIEIKIDNITSKKKSAE